MKKKALFKDFCMELKKTANRFLSILLIVMLGVAFFSGIRAAEGDMCLSMDAYFDEKELFDIRVIGTYGLDDKDVRTLKDELRPERIEGGYSQDMLCSIDGSQKVIKVLSQSDTMNGYDISEGEDISADDMCLLDANFAQRNNMSVGDKLTLFCEDEDAESILKIHTFTVSGICHSSQYISFERGNSNLGKGEVDAYILVRPEVFDSEVYTRIDMILSKDKELVAYSDEYEEHIDKKIQEIEDGVAVELKKADRQRVVDKAMEEIAENESKLLDAQKEYDDGKEQLEEGKEQIQYISFFLTNDEYKEQLQKLEDAETELEDARLELEDARRELEDAKQEVRELEECKWYVQSRNDLPQFDQGGENAKRIGAIGKVFPVIFFMVAALISLTTMTRMVEEERTQIGTLKALGYSDIFIAAKYIGYAFLATAFGGVFGVLIGEKTIPAVIIIAYRIMFPGIMQVVIPYELKFSILAILGAIFCTLGATVFSCYRELMSNAAELMRPIPPKNGKRILLERITFFWKRLKFTQKASLRNMFRYKKRFFMTILGIGGCMGLMVFGFGLKDSIFDIVDLQYSQLTRYQAMISMSDEDKIDDVLKELSKQEQLEYATPIYMSNEEFYIGKNKVEAYMFVPGDEKNIRTYLTLRERITKQELALDREGAVVTEKLADLLGASVGDSIEVEIDGKEYKLNIASIAENYMYHYVYMSKEYYQRVFGGSSKENMIIYQTDSEDEKVIKQVGKQVMASDGVLGITYMSSMKEQLDHMLESLNSVMIIIVGAAGMLAFIVLYNLNNININERKRELATIKVLGFYNEELAAYVYRENILLTILGVMFGAVFGKFLHHFIIVTVEIDTCMFSRGVNLDSYIYSATMTILFALIVNIVMYVKLKKIDMIESLKSVE